MERPRIYTEKQGKLLADFVLVMRDFHQQSNLSPEEISQLKREHIHVVSECLAEGLLDEICDIKNNWDEQYGRED